MPSISLPDPEFQKFLQRKMAESKRTSQKKKQNLKEAPPQSVVLGSPTRDWDNDLETVVKMNREEVGSPNPPTFWALEIARAVRDFGGVPGKDAYDMVIQRAKQTGLSDEQKKAIDQILIHWRIPIPGIKEGDLGPNGSVYAPVKSDATMSFPQRQVAASLKASRELSDRIASLEEVHGYYTAHKASLNDAFNKRVIKNRVAQLLKQNFSRTDIATDMASWNFPENLVREAINSLLPKKVALSNGQRVSLSNGFAKSASDMARKAQTTLERHVTSRSEKLTDQQALRLSALSSRFALETPFWIRGGRTDSTRTIEAMAKIEDGRVLTAMIEPDGQCSFTTRFEPMLKKSIRKAGSVPAGWIEFLRFDHRASLPGIRSAQVKKTWEERQRDMANRAPLMSDETWRKQVTKKFEYLASGTLEVTEYYDLDRLFSEYGTEQALEMIDEGQIVEDIKHEFIFDDDAGHSDMDEEESEDGREHALDFDDAFEKYRIGGMSAWRWLQNRYEDRNGSITMLDDLPDSIGEELSEAFVSEWNGDNMAQYLYDNLKPKISSITALPFVKESGYGANGDKWQVKIVATSELTPEDLESLRDWLTGQASDGFGEGFEQQELSSEHAGVNGNLPGRYAAHMWNHKAFNLEIKPIAE